MADNNILEIKSAQVGIIGVGNMGEALLVALLKAGADGTKINFAVRRAERNAEISAKYGIKSATIEEMASQSDVLMIIVKPNDLETIMAKVKPNLKSGTLIISFLAAKKIATLELGLGNPAVVRVMPNTPTFLGAGMSIVSYGEHVRADQRRFVEKFLQAAGKSVEVDEALQDAATATSGSGPAYFFAFVEAMVSGAVALGLDEATATELVVQTIVGAAKMLEESGKSATTLRENVTSHK
ncbi:MAG TPA: pyrroline-5-carboxylate reductase, partial [Candidatus Nanopelagicaceae bacterium]